jgi:hypothetical protein
MLQLPGMFAHGTFELHDAWVFAHVPLLEQSFGPLQGTEGSFTHVPTIFGHWVSTVQFAELVLHVPSVRHWLLP